MNNMKNILGLLILLLFSCQPQEEKTDSDIYYTCSMHPQIMEAKPGKCPICHMTLTIAHKQKNKEDDALHLSDEQVHLGHIVVAPVQQHYLGDEITLTGELAVNQDQQSSISSRVMGRIEKLYFKNTGDEIKKGSAVYDIYSEDLNLAAKELKLAVEKKKTFSSGTSDMDKLIQSARNKLLLYGLNPEQVNQIENGKNISSTFTVFSSREGIVTTVDVREGQYLMEGQDVYHLADLSILWAEAQVYAGDLPRLKENMPASIYFPGQEKLKAEGKISFINPELNPSSKIGLVRVEVANRDHLLKAGMQVNVVVLLNKVKVMALPVNAAVKDSKGISVWIKSGHNAFKNTMITTGLESAEYLQIVNGLKEGDSVVVSGAYLLSSEYLFKKGSNPMSGHDMGKMKM